MLHRIEIYREPYSHTKDKNSEFKLNLLQTIESEYLSAAVDLGIDFMRSNLRTQNLSADDINERTWICSNCGSKHDRDINAAINLGQCKEYTVLTAV